MATPNPIDYQVIKNNIALYCIALDSKNFDLFKRVFTDDVVALFPFGPNGRYESSKELADAMSSRLQPMTTQHIITTQTIEIDEGGETATAVTYFTALHFGTGKWEGKQVFSCGRYEDDLILIRGKQSLPGASGDWLVKTRKLVFMGRWGEEGVRTGE